MGRPSTCREPYSPGRKYVTVPGYAGHVSQMRFQHSRTFQQTATRAFTVAEQKLHEPKPNSLVPFEPADLYAFGPNPRRKTNIRNSSSVPCGDPRKRPMVTTNVGMGMVPRAPMAPRVVMPGWQEMSKEDRKHEYAKAIRYIGGLDNVKPMIEALRHKILCRIGGQGALARAFKWFDLDNSGSIDVDEFCQATSVIFTLDFTDMQVIALFAVYDNSLTGSISYYEFIQKVMADSFNPMEVQNTVQKLLHSQDTKAQISYDVLKPFIDGGFLVMPNEEMPLVYTLKRSRSSLDEATKSICTQVYHKFKDPATGLMSYEQLGELMTHLDAADCPHPEQAVHGYEIGDSLSSEQFWEWWQAYVTKFHDNRHGPPQPHDERIGPEGDGHSWQHSRRRQGKANPNVLVRALSGDWEVTKTCALDLGDDSARDDLGLAPDGSLLNHSARDVNMMSSTLWQRPMPPEAPSNRPALRASRAIVGEPQTNRPRTDQPRFYEDPMSVSYQPTNSVRATAGRLPFENSVAPPNQAAGVYPGSLRPTHIQSATRLPPALPGSETGFVARLRGSSTARGYTQYNRQVSPSSASRPLTDRPRGQDHVSWAGGSGQVRRVTGLGSGTIPLCQPRPSASRGCMTGYKI